MNPQIKDALQAAVLSSGIRPRIALPDATTVDALGFAFATLLSYDKRVEELETEREASKYEVVLVRKEGEWRLNAAKAALKRDCKTRAKVKELETELALRKGVRYPDYQPSDQCVQIWTHWKNDFEPARFQWITRNKCSLVDGEWWRVIDDASPYESKEVAP